MRLNDSLLTYNRGAGLRAQGNHDTIVSACQFEENRDGVVFTDGFNLTLSGNNIDDHLRHGVPVTGNTFVRCKQFGVRVSTYSGRSVISGNTFCDTFAGKGPRQIGPRKDNLNINEGENERILYEHNQAVSCADVDAKVTQALGTGPLTPLSSSTSALQVAAVLHDETALAGALDIEISDGLAYVVGKGFTRRGPPLGGDGVFLYEAGKGGTGVFKLDGRELASKKLEHSIPLMMTIDETFDVGIDTRTGVDDSYTLPFKFTGTIDKLTFNLGPSQLSEADKNAAAASGARARD